MFIVWGTRRTERNLGYVADFCPVCREPRAFRLVRVGLASHIYYISFGSGKLVGHLIRCQECGTDFDTEPARYAAVEQKRPVHLSGLIQATFPNLQATYAPQIAEEAEIRSAPRALPPSRRHDLLIEPFRHLAGAVEARYARGTEMDKPAGIGCFATTLLFVGISVIALNFKGPVPDSLMIAFASVVGIGVLYTFVQIGLAPGRFLRARIVPQLARSLDPLQPDEAELTNCLKICRDVRWKIGSKIKPKAILAEIERRRAAA